MRFNFINNFYRDPSIADMTASAGNNDPNWVDAVDTLSGDVVGLLGAINGTKTTVVRNGGSTTTGYSTSNGSVSSNAILYILLAVAAIVCVFLFLKK